jgi:hypothetical protein
MSERILKDAQDALVFQDAPTPLVGGQNVQLNSQLRSSKHKPENLVPADTPVVGKKRVDRDD